VADWRDDRGRVCARAFAGVAGRSIDCPGVGVFLFDDNVSDVQVWPDAGVPPDAVTECFNRIVHPLVLQARGRQVLHGSAALGADGVWVFCARSGGGKSTLAYALAQRGYLQIADDAVVLDVSSGVLVEPIPFDARLRDSSFNHFVSGALRPASREAVAPAPLAAIFLIAQDAAAAGPTLARVAAPDILHALLPHCHVFDDQDPHERARVVEAVYQLGERVPVARLTYPPRFDQLDAIVDAIVAHAACRTS
jgi:hypothetical protein